MAAPAQSPDEGAPAAPRGLVVSLRNWLSHRLGRRPSDPEGNHALFDHAPWAVIVHGDGVIIAANEAAAHLFGFRNAAEMQSLDLRALCGDTKTRECLDQRIASAGSLAHGAKLPPVRYKLRTQQGHDVHVRAMLVKDRWHGKPAMFSLFVDETAEASAHEALLQSESMLQSIFEGCPFPMSITDRVTGRLSMVNAAYCEMVGCRPEQLIGRSTLELNFWAGGLEQRARVLRQLEASQGHTLFHEPLRRADGKTIIVHGGMAFVGDRTNPQLVFIGADVTLSQQRQAELEAIMDQAPGCILVTEGEIIRSASPRLMELAGQPNLEPIGRNVRDLWLDQQAFDDIAQSVQRQIQTTGKADLVRPHKRPDGSTIQLRVQGSRLRSEPNGRQAMVWILSDITTEMEAFRAREAAEASAKAKTAFLAVMSHELRTPLNGILGLAELARARDTRAAERKEYLHQLADCANSLADILNDILDLSKIEAGRMQLDPQATSVNEFFSRLRSTYTSLAEARGLAFKVTLAHNLPSIILIDPVRLRQIVANFLGNALKFTPSGHIELKASRVGESLRIEVQDSGTGIPEEMLARLFTPFEQARSTNRNRPAGTGLGLAICHHLAQLMEGRVGAENRDQGGALFWIEIPLRRPDAHAVARAQQDLQDRDRLEADLTGVKVLLAEDNEINALITMRALISAGARAERVADGQAAVAAVQAAETAGDPYSVVLMDVQMPVMDGLQATRELRGQDCGQGLRIISLTAGALAEQREECRQAGMDAYLTKPLHRERLLSEVLLQSKLAHNRAQAEPQLRF